MIMSTNNTILHWHDPPKKTSFEWQKMYKTWYKKMSLFKCQVLGSFSFTFKWQISGASVTYSGSLPAGQSTSHWLDMSVWRHQRSLWGRGHRGHRPRSRAELSSLRRWGWRFHWTPCDSGAVLVDRLGTRGVRLGVNFGHIDTKILGLFSISFSTFWLDWS